MPDLWDISLVKMSHKIVISPSPATAPVLQQPHCLPEAAFAKEHTR
jgi:hypothetical protein